MARKRSPYWLPDDLMLKRKWKIRQWNAWSVQFIAAMIHAPPGLMELDAGSSWTCRPFALSEKLDLDYRCTYWLFMHTEPLNLLICCACSIIYQTDIQSEIKSSLTLLIFFHLQMASCFLQLCPISPNVTHLFSAPVMAPLVFELNNMTQNGSTVISLILSNILVMLQFCMFSQDT